MQIHEIKNDAIIIAPPSTHKDIRLTLLQNTVYNVDVVSLENYIHYKEDASTMYLYYNALSQIQDTLHFFKKSIHSKHFIKELMQFIGSMKQHQIQIESNVWNTPIDLELLHIIKHMYTIPLGYDYMWIPTPKVSIYIVDGYTTILQNKIIQLLCEQGATRISITHKLETKQYFYALNIRKEVESVAQYITKHQIPIKDMKISILDASYIPYIKHVFTNYQIPYSIHNDRYTPKLVFQHIALLQYYINPTLKNAMRIIHEDVFSIKHTKHFITYANMYDIQLDIPFQTVEKAIISRDIISEKEYQRLLYIEQHAECVRTQLLEYLSPLIACTSLFEVFHYVDSLTINTQQDIDISSLRKIRQVYALYHRHIKGIDDLPFCIELLKDIQTSHTVEDGVRITSLIDNAMHTKYHFVLGCTQANFPNLSIYNGIFKEEHYEWIAPLQLQNRFQLHVEKLLQLLSTSTHLICFYPLSSFDGKPYETALEMDRFLVIKEQAFPLQEQYTPYTRTYSLQKEYAKELFFKNDEIQASASRFEQYARCPYAFFLRYALHLEEALDVNFDIRKEGLLQHYALEHLTPTKDFFANIPTKDAIHTLIQTKIEELAKLYPKLQTQLHYSAIHLEKKLLLNFAILAQQESDDAFTTHTAEYPFTYTIKDKLYQITIRGYIDRVDQNGDFFRILDYKSSAKKMVDSQFNCGLQLQLPTYAIAMQKQLNRRASGAFYYGMQLPIMDMEFAKLKKRPLEFVIHKEEDVDAFIQKEKRLQGWVLDANIEVLDKSGSHIVGFSNAKTSGLKARKIHDFKIVETWVETIYKHFANSIYNGDIDCKSVEGACTYCNYASICKKAHRHYTPTPIIQEEQ